MEDYIKTILARANTLYEKSKISLTGDENKMWLKNAQFALDNALRLTLINLNIDGEKFSVKFNEDAPNGNEVLVNGRPIDASIEGLYDIPPAKLQGLGSGDMLMPDTELKK